MLLTARQLERLRAELVLYHWMHGLRISGDLTRAFCPACRLVWTTADGIGSAAAVEL